MSSLGHHPQLKNEALPPSEKQSPPLLEREVIFHEMIPRKSTINDNLKSSNNPSEMCVKKFIFSKFAGLQAYTTLLSNQLRRRYFFSTEF